MQGFHFVANSFRVAMTAQRPFSSGVINFSAGNLFVTSCLVIRKDLDLTESTKYMTYHLAEVNIGRILGEMDSPVMAEFAANLNRINALAEGSEGFIWRLKDDSNNATSIPVTEDRFLILNMSVWRNIDDLFAYTYRTAHAEYVRRRGEWFERLKEMHMAFWYIPAGHIPTVSEAMDRIAHIREHGPSPYAFNFKRRFTADEAAGAVAGGAI
jgi:uncharacterized protein DUF3291